MYLFRTNWQNYVDMVLFFVLNNYKCLKEKEGVYVLSL